MHKFIVCTDVNVDREKHKTESFTCNLQSENFSFSFRLDQFTPLVFLMTSLHAFVLLVF